jgi:hypothetical protein
MIQFILMLFGLVLPNNNNSIEVSGASGIIKAQSLAVDSNEATDDTSGETGNIPPPKKPSK